MSLELKNTMKGLAEPAERSLKNSLHDQSELGRSLAVSRIGTITSLVKGSGGRDTSLSF